MSELITWAIIIFSVSAAGYVITKIAGFCGMCGKLSTKKELVDGKCSKCN